MPVVLPKPVASKKQFDTEARTRLRRLTKLHLASLIAEDSVNKKHILAAREIHELVQTIPLSETRPRGDTESALRAIRAILKVWEKQHPEQLLNLDINEEEEEM